MKGEDRHPFELSGQKRVMDVLEIFRIRKGDAGALLLAAIPIA
jgi:hypothetical protein